MSDTKIKSSNIGNLAVTHDKLHTTMDLTGKTVTVATPSAATHPATKAYVDTEVANLIDSAPGTLDTLNELAAAVNDDANFNATIASSIATKLPLAGGTMTGAIDMGSNNITTTGKMLFANMYATEGDLPSASTYHGMFAHVHATGKGYYAHGGAWVQLANAGATGGGYEDADTAAYLATVQNKSINTTGGNVGIGVSNPDYPLVVQAASGGNTVKMIGRAADSISGLVFSNTGNTAANYIQGDSSFIRARADGGFHFRKGGTPVTTDAGAFTIQGLNVGIGVSNPGTRLQVAGTQNVPSGTSKGMLLVRADGSSHGLQMGVNSSAPWGSWIQAQDNNISSPYPLTLQPGGGNVGIGTTAPSEQLHIFNNSQSWDAYARIRLGTESSGYEGSLGYHRGTTDDADRGLYLSGSGTTKHVNVRYNGSVGIGNNIPAYKLDVGGTFDIQGRFKSSGGTGWTQGAIVIESSDSTSNPGNRGQGVYMYNVPNQRTWYSGTLYNNGNKFGIGYQQAAGLQHIAADNVKAKLVIDGDTGNAGIGTTAPLTTLMLESTGGNLTGGSAIKSSTMKGLTLNAQEGSAHTNSLGVWFGSNGSHWSGIAGGRSNTSTWGTDLRFYTHQDNTVDLTSTHERMVITEAGNVGIGVQVPTAALDVRGIFNSQDNPSSTVTGASSTVHNLTNISRVSGKINIPIEVFFANGTSNLCIRLYYTTSSLWTAGEVIMGATYSSAGAMGFRRYTFSHCYNGSNAYQTVTTNTENVGVTSSHFSFDSHGWDSTEGAHYFEFRHLASSGNSLWIQFQCHGSAPSSAFSGNWYYKHKTF